MLQTMKATPYDYWLGRDNPTFVSDIQKVYRGDAILFGQNYDLTLRNQKFSINYTVARMTQTILNEAGDLVEEFAGVVVVLEDISKEKRVMATLGRYMNAENVQRVVKDGNLSGCRQRVSILYADLRNCNENSKKLYLYIITYFILNISYSVG
jgi:hypothetical protein